MLSLALLLTLPSADTTENQRPNLVVFLSDDHTATDSTLYGSRTLADGAPESPTPNLARVAADGVTMTRAYVASPACAPSRAALLTGLTPPSNGAVRNHDAPREDIKKLPAYLDELGYETASFGKVGHYGQTPMYGFGTTRHYGYHEDVAIPKAIEWLRSRGDGRDGVDRDGDGRPLCLFVGTNWPHVPWPQGQPADGVEVPGHHVDTPETRQARANYLEAVAQMDRELGAVYDAAYDVLGDDTLFLHTSDHGAQWPFGKWNLYEEGVRTPMVAVWPGRIEPGGTSDAIVSWLDILPTLVDAAGGDAAELAETLHGRSLLPVFTCEADSHRDHVVLTHEGDGGFNVFPMRGVRRGRFKYIRNLHPNWEFTSHVTEVRNRVGEKAYWPSWDRKASESPAAAAIVDRYTRRPPEELYNLDADPLEQTNLLAAEGELSPPQRDALAAMKADLASWQQTHDDFETMTGPPQFQPDGRRANVVLVLVDDMGQADLGCFGGPVSTPNIDRLAREGRRFTQFYVSAPICSPSRVALTTGQYPARSGVTSYLAKRALNRQRGMPDWLDETAPTLPRALSEAGYACGHFGKWHMGGQRDVGDAPHPKAYGFARSLVNFEGLGPRVLPLKIDPTQPGEPKRHDLGSAALRQGPIETLDRSQVTGRFVDEAIAFIDEASGEGVPFYVNVWPDDVHAPFFPLASRWATLPQTDDPTRSREFYDAVLHEMDTQLGPLFDRIRTDPALAANTIVLLCSDHGPVEGLGRSGRFRGEKGMLYEGGIRSPLIVWAPGLAEPDLQPAVPIGGVNETTHLSSIDLVASLRTLCGLPSARTDDGRDLASVLIGVSNDRRRGELYWRRPPDRGQMTVDGEQARMPDLAIRDRNLKLLCDLDGSNVELYDVVADPGETKNLASKRPQQREKLKASLMQWNRRLPKDGVAGVGRTP